MRLSIFKVDVNFLATILADLRCLATLIFNMELHVFFFKPQTASLRALDHSITPTLELMFHRCCVISYKLATVVFTFEFEIS